MIKEKKKVKEEEDPLQFAVGVEGMKVIMWFPRQVGSVRFTADEAKTLANLLLDLSRKVAN